MIKSIVDIDYITIHEDDTEIKNGVPLYRITSNKPAKDGGADIGIDVYMARSARIGDGFRAGNGFRAGDNADIRNQYDMLLAGPIGSRRAYTSIWRREDNRMMVSCGCPVGVLWATSTLLPPPSKIPTMATSTA